MRKRIDARAMGAFVSALETGAHVKDAAKAAGFGLSSFYWRRKRCPAFAAAWDEAVARSAGPMLIAAGNGRRLQKRRSRRVRFTRERKQAFLDHFASTCDSTASAEAAGVCASTMYRHLASDAAFAEAWQDALEAGYRALEAELVGRQRAAVEAYRTLPDAEALAAAAGDFERTMKLLAGWRRKDGRVGKRDGPRDGARARWDFDEAMAALEKKLKAFGARRASAAQGTGEG